MPDPTPGQSNEDITDKYDENICVCLPLQGHHRLVLVMCSEHSGNFSCCCLVVAIANIRQLTLATLRQAGKDNVLFA